MIALSRSNNARVHYGSAYEKPLHFANCISVSAFRCFRRAVYGGAVNLTGTVKSEEEKRAVEDKATEIAGSGKMTSELTVSGK